MAYSSRFFMLTKLGEIHLIPTIAIYFSKHSFFETGVYTPQLVVSIKFLKYQVGIDIQQNPYKP
jgi:hypothetical protein